MVCSSNGLPARIRLAGRDIASKATEDIVRAGVAHVPEGRGTFTRVTT